MADNSTPHSLPPTQPTSPKKKKPTQLPLPSSNFSASRSQPLPSSLPSPTRQSTSRPYGRSASTTVRAGSALPIGGGDREKDAPVLQQSSSSPTVPTFQQAYNPNSTTHAGGIQPTANFFRPLKAYQLPRPSSTGSADSSSNGLAIMAPDPGLFQLAPLTHQRSHSSEDLSGSTHAADETLPEPAGAFGAPEIRNLDDEELRRQFSAPKRMKHSREPLLPIGGRALTSINTSPTAHSTSYSRGMPQRSPASSKPDKASPITPVSGGPAKRMRNSIDRMFRRGVSFDSTRKSMISIGSPSEGRRTFEGKQTDDDRNIFPMSSSRYKDTGAVSGPFTHDLNISASQLPISPSPDPSFISTPPLNRPLLWAVPVKSPSGGLVRNYQTHPSRNKFMIRGRFLTGGDSPWAFIGSLGLALAITGVWFGTTCVWWWKNESPAVAAVGAYLCLITISTMLTTAMRDPGILPRGLDPNPPYPSTSPSDGSRAPLPRDLKVREDTVRVKYCPTCKTYRPPRSSHCKMCDNCVDGCDHHCQWVNNCVGRRNYTSFIAFLTSAVTTLVLVIITSALHIYLLTARENLNFRRALVHGLGSAIAFLLSVLVIWPVAALLIYHFRLLLLNITTIEQIRNSAHKSLEPGAKLPNPFSHGTWRRNLAEVLCRPAGASWLDGRGIKTEDRRELNPAVSSRDMERGLGSQADWDRDLERGDD